MRWRLVTEFRNTPSEDIIKTITKKKTNKNALKDNDIRSQNSPRSDIILPILRSEHQKKERERETACLKKHITKENGLSHASDPIIHAKCTCESVATLIATKYQQIWLVP